MEFFSWWSKLKHWFLWVPCRIFWQIFLTNFLTIWFDDFFDNFFDDFVWRIFFDEFWLLGRFFWPIIFFKLISVVTLLYRQYQRYMYCDIRRRTSTSRRHRCEIFFSLLFSLKTREKYISFAHLVLLSLYIFCGKCVYFSILEW